jgi:hypothetical protein
MLNCDGGLHDAAKYAVPETLVQADKHPPSAYGNEKRDNLIGESRGVRFGWLGLLHLRLYFRNRWQLIPQRLR